MPKAVDCQFCGFYLATVTAIRTAPSGKKSRLQLCDRCQFLHQTVIQVKPLEDALEAPPCLLCRGLSQFTAECHDQQGAFLGRYRLCPKCVGRQELTVADMIKIATPWTPGVLELPSLDGVS